MKGKVHRAQISTAANYIYPDKQNKFNAAVHGKNIKELKKIQEKNEQKKIEKENFVPAKPFKIKEFENAQPKINTVNETKLHPKNTIKKTQSHSLIKPKTAENKLEQRMKNEIDVNMSNMNVQMPYIQNKNINYKENECN